MISGINWTNRRTPFEEFGSMTWQIFFAECHEKSTRQIASLPCVRQVALGKSFFFIFLVLFFFLFCSSKYITMHFENTRSNSLNNMYLICYFYYYIIYAVISQIKLFYNCIWHIKIIKWFQKITKISHEITYVLYCLYKRFCSQTTI